MLYFSSTWLIYFITGSLYLSALTCSNTRFNLPMKITKSVRSNDKKHEHCQEMAVPWGSQDREWVKTDPERETEYLRLPLHFWAFSQSQWILPQFSYHQYSKDRKINTSSPPTSKREVTFLTFLVKWWTIIKSLPPKMSTGKLSVWELCDQCKKENFLRNHTHLTHVFSN